METPAPASHRVGASCQVRESVWVVQELFSQSECREMIALATAQGMVDLAAEYGGTLRNCLRVEVDDEALAASVFERLLPLIPAEVVVGAPNNHPQGTTLQECSQPATPPGIKPNPELQGTWRAVGCNSHWRIACYPGGKCGGHFGPHRDSEFVESPDRRSLLTVNGYLNALPVGMGGSTRFLQDDQPMYKDSAGRLAPVPGTIEHSVQPLQAGMATVFFHDLLHDGEPLKTGCPAKWICRTDVIYERVPGTGPQAKYSDAQLRARALFSQAEGLEAQDAVRAAQLYRAAFQLDRTLEDAMRY